MDLETIYNLLRMWFLAWLLFRCYEIIRTDLVKISANLRQK